MNLVHKSNGSKEEQKLEPGKQHIWKWKWRQ